MGNIGRGESWLIEIRYDRGQLNKFSNSLRSEEIQIIPGDSYPSSSFGQRILLLHRSVSVWKIDGRIYPSD
jgi:hypothetical protein